MPPVITKSIIVNNNAPVGCPPGGTEDQLLAKNSNLNFDYKWVDAADIIPTVKTFVGNFTQVSGGTVTQLNSTQSDALTGIVWTFGAAPNWYTGTKVGAFPNAAKVFVTTDLMADIIVYTVINANEISIESTGLSAVEGKIKIEVYP